MPDRLITNPLSRLRSRGGDSIEILVELHDRPTEDEIRRSENFQLAVTTVILSIYVTSSTSNTGSIIFPQNELFVLSALSSTFLLGKLSMSTIRPYYDHSYLRTLDHTVLPFVFMTTFLSSGVRLSLSVIQMPNVPTIRPYIDSIIILSNNPMTIAVYVLVVTILGGIYAWNTRIAMIDLESDVPDIEVTFTSGTSESSVPLRIKNPTPKKIFPDDVHIVLKSSSGVNVDVRNADMVNDNTWKPSIPINPDGGAMTIHLDLSRPENVNNISDQEIEVEIRFRGQTQQRHLINLTG